MKGDADPVSAPNKIAQSFRDLNFHDHTLIDMKVFPTQSRDDVIGAVIEIQLLQPSGKKQVLRFVGCANLKVGLDFDVLANNLPPNTSGVAAHTDQDLMADLMRLQEPDWDVNYVGSSPLHKKLNLLAELICFRIQFFGGPVEIIARQYQVESFEP